MNCLDCRFALWNKTANGRLHPSGDGKCTWKMPHIDLPFAYFYHSGRDTHSVPSPSGGWINRGRLEECKTWEAK